MEPVRREPPAGLLHRFFGAPRVTDRLESTEDHSWNLGTLVEMFEQTWGQGDVDETSRKVTVRGRSGLTQIEMTGEANSNGQIVVHQSVDLRDSKALTYGACIAASPFASSFLFDVDMFGVIVDVVGTLITGEDLYVSKAILAGLTIGASLLLARFLKKSREIRVRRKMNRMRSRHLPRGETPTERCSPGLPAVKQLGTREG